MKTRSPRQLRSVVIQSFPTAAPGSIVIAAGRTKILCAASVSTDLPPHLKPKPGEKPTQGWVTAEYNMLPGSTPDRKKRGPDSRGTEIQRLIGRSLRAAVDMTLMPGLAVTVDCDVLVADGGTRTAAITGGFVALAQALAWARKKGLLTGDPIVHQGIAAVSVGMIEGQAHLDLDYALDVRAQVDLNVVMNGRGELVEIQGTAEHAPFSRQMLNELLDLAEQGISKLRREQKRALQRT